LNMAESIERVLKRRALDGQHPHSPAEIGGWFEQTARAWNEQPTPFVWKGKAGSGGDDPVAIKPIGSAALGHARADRSVETVQPEHQIRMPDPTTNDPLEQAFPARLPNTVRRKRCRVRR
jgi:hypothetical protein